MIPHRLIIRSSLRSAGVVLAILAAASPAFSDMVIAKRGKPLATIVLAPDAGETEVYAAEELALHLRAVTGAVFNIVRGADAGKASGRLIVGPAAARFADPSFDASGLAPEEIIARASGRDLILSGGSPRGTLYAVYAFLEDVVGCRWWTRTANHVPWKPTLKVGDVSLRFKPPFEYREPFWYVAFDPAWAARNKANGIQAGGDSRRGGHQSYEGFVHTFYSLIPPATYFKDHPEWFSEIEGTRRTDRAQLCLTNEEMRREFVKNLKERLVRNPEATIASVSQNDCFGNCTCARCRAVDEEEGSPAGSLLRFVNDVAQDIEAEFPNVAIDTLAYQYTRKPPRLVRPRPNVIVRLCSIECSFSRPLDHPKNKTFLDDLEGWSRIAGRLYVWDYTTNFAHYVQPHPNYRVLAPNIRLFAGRNVRGIFEQGAYQSWGSEMAELRAWMLAKLLWNPSLDPEKLRREFLRGYFGPAAGPVDDYLNVLESAAVAADDHLGCFSSPEAKFLSLNTLEKSWALLQKAERKAAPVKEYARRVRLAQLPVAYVVVVKWDKLREEAKTRGLRWPWPSTREDLLAWLLKSARGENVTMISEWQKLDDWAAKGGRTK
jgi:hypothetical protein